MKIAFSEILGREINRRITDDSWFPHEDLELVAPVEGLLNLRRTGDNEVLVTGRLTAAVKTVCDRCGQPAEVELSAEFLYDCVVGEEDSRTRHEAECRDEDYYRHYLEEPVIDTADILREQVFLALPASVLCRPGCQGLCPQCGTNLNTGSCSCDSSDPSSPFAVLKRLKGD